MPDDAVWAAHMRRKQEVATVTDVPLPVVDRMTDNAALVARVAQETRPVTAGWDPGAFRWLTAEEARAVGRHGGRTAAPPFIRLGRTRGGGRIVLSRRAVDWIPVGRRVLVGVAPRAIAIRLVEGPGTMRVTGLSPTKAGSANGAISCGLATSRLVADGWPTDARIPATWDPEHQMLVIRKPDGRDAP